MKSNVWLPLLTAVITIIGGLSGFAEETQHGSVVTEHLLSVKLNDTRTGLAPNRTIKVYLPPGYASSGKSYPVVYYCHSLNWSAEKMFEDGNLVKLLERGFTNRIVPEFILVAADYSSPTLGSWYENSSTSGRWLDYTVDEVVPFIDSRFRTIKHRDSRGLTGDFVGGYGAMKLALLYPDLFSSVYAMHVVGTGTGVAPSHGRPDWKKIHQAGSFQELEASGFARPFVGMCQAYLPNPARPPLYCDFMVELENGEPKVNMENVNNWQSRFILDHMLAEKSENLQRLRGIAFDWARYDPNLDHVYANQAFTRKLDELGIEHEAEEYRGDPWSRNWTENGRFYTRVLPFLNRYLTFE
jgi:pimeloyl-ACP methyl ester carboxylesterase